MGEHVVAGGDRRMGREDRALTDNFTRLSVGAAALYQFAHTFQRQKRRVAFVRVPDCRRNAQRTKEAHAADAQENLLTEPHLLVATIQSRRQRTVLRSVFRYIGIDQKERNTTHQHFPNDGCDISAAHVDGEPALFARWRQGRMDWRILPIKRRVGGFLPPFLCDSLTKITLRIHEPNTNERDAQIARFLAMISREDTETAAVNGNGGMEAEFGGKVGDDFLRVPGVLGAEPTPPVGLVLVKQS